MDSFNRKMKAVYTVVEKPGNKSVWVRIGWANENHDGSFNLNLDALPVNGRLQVRDWESREDWLARGGRREEQASAPPM